MKYKISLNIGPACIKGYAILANRPTLALFDIFDFNCTIWNKKRHNCTISSSKGVKQNHIYSITQVEVLLKNMKYSILY